MRLKIGIMRLKESTTLYLETFKVVSTYIHAFEKLRIADKEIHFIEWASLLTRPKSFIYDPFGCQVIIYVPL